MKGSIKTGQRGVTINHGTSDHELSGQWLQSLFLHQGSACCCEEKIREKLSVQRLGRVQYSDPLKGCEAKKALYSVCLKGPKGKDWNVLPVLGGCKKQ